MKKLNKKTKEVFNKIKISDSRSNEIMTEILDSKKKSFILKPIIISCFAIMICMIGIVYAEEIVSTFNTFRFKMNDKKGALDMYSDAIAEIDYDANIPEAERESLDKNGKYNNYYSYEDLEGLLKIKLLKSSYFGNNLLHQRTTKKVNNKIAAASFGIENFTNSNLNSQTNLPDDWKIEFFNMSFSFKTKFATEDIKENYSYSFFTGGDSQTEEYYIKNLKTSALLIFTNHSKHCIVKFDYDNISYFFDLSFFGNWDSDSTHFRVEEILETLSY